MEFGETYINREHFEAIQGFHAGVKKSGIGGADGKHGVEEYLVTHVTYLDTYEDIKFLESTSDNNAGVPTKR